MAEAVAVRHVAFEDLGTFEECLRGAGYGIRYLEAGVDDLGAVIALDPDLLIVLGGPISANDEADYPFLKDELRLLERRLDSGRPTMGICLGAQLLARAAGGRVYTGETKEIGFLPIRLTEAGKQSCLASFESDDTVLHWHGDCCDLPAEAICLAFTELCPTQAFSIGSNAIGFQFHPEISAVGFERWLIGNNLELTLEGRGIPALRDQAYLCHPAMRKRATTLLRSWLSQLDWQLGAVR